MRRFALFNFSFFFFLLRNDDILLHQMKRKLRRVFDNTKLETRVFPFFFFALRSGQRLSPFLVVFLGNDHSRTSLIHVFSLTIFFF